MPGSLLLCLRGGAWLGPPHSKAWEFPAPLSSEAGGKGGMEHSQPTFVLNSSKLQENYPYSKA